MKHDIDYVYVLSHTVCGCCCIFIVWHCCFIFAKAHFIEEKKWEWQQISIVVCLFVTFKMSNVNGLTKFKYWMQTNTMQLKQLCVWVKVKCGTMWSALKCAGNLKDSFVVCNLCETQKNNVSNCWHEKDKAHLSFINII